MSFKSIKNLYRLAKEEQQLNTEDAMDIPLILAQKLYASEKYPTFFIFRMWIGYGFDAAEFTIVNVRYGFVYSSVEWMYVFYVYLGLLVLVAFLMTVIFRIKKPVSEKRFTPALPTSSSHRSLTQPSSSFNCFFKVRKMGPPLFF